MPENRSRRGIRLQYPLAAVLACALPGWGPASRAATVGDPAHPDALMAALSDAYARGERDITIAPGVYELPPAAKDTIALQRWTDAAVHAAGVTLVFHDLHDGHRPVHFIGCNHVTFEGATLRFSAPAATQGRVTALGSDDHGPWCDWRADAGYAADVDPVKSTWNVVDHESRVLKVRTGDFRPASAEPLPSGAVRFRFRGALPRFEVGDWLVTRAKAGSIMCHADGCRDVTLKDLTMENGGFGTFFETGGAGGNHYRHCRIHCGPRPPGATEDQVVACGADGFHSAGTAAGPEIDDCDFDGGVFLDDCIAVHGTFHAVLASSGATLEVEAGGDAWSPQDPVRLSDDKGFFAQATVLAAKSIKAEAGQKGRVQLTLDHALDVPAGAKAGNPNRCGRGYRITRCRLGHTRSRGILVKADDGLIDGCTIDGCGMSAVSIGPEYYWNEADYCWDVTVSHNVIRHCDQGNDAHNSPLLVHGDGAIGNRRIVIRDNLFDTDYGDAVLRFEWTDGLEITNNRITHPHELPLAKPGNVIRLAHVRDVKLLGNVVESPGPASGDLVGVANDVSGLTDNDESGIQKK